jgi:hypothetical protein
MAAAGGAEGEGPAAQGDFAGVGRREAEQDTRQLGAAGADQPGEAENLAGADLEADVVHPGRRTAEPAQRQHDLAGRGFGWRVGVGYLAAHHQVDQLGLGRVGDAAGADALAVAQDGDAVGDRENLLQAVGNVDDADALSRRRSRTMAKSAVAPAG